MENNLKKKFISDHQLKAFHLLVVYYTNFDALENPKSQLNKSLKFLKYKHEEIDVYTIFSAFVELASAGYHPATLFLLSEPFSPAIPMNNAYDKKLTNGFLISKDNAEWTLKQLSNQVVADNSIHVVDYMLSYQIINCKPEYEIIFESAWPIVNRVQPMFSDSFAASVCDTDWFPDRCSFTADEPCNYDLSVLKSLFRCRKINTKINDYRHPNYLNKFAVPSLLEQWKCAMATKKKICNSNSTTLGLHRIEASFMKEHTRDMCSLLYGKIQKSFCFNSRMEILQQQFLSIEDIDEDCHWCPNHILMYCDMLCDDILTLHQNNPAHFTKQISNQSFALVELVVPHFLKKVKNTVTYYACTRSLGAMLKPVWNAESNSYLIE